MGTRHRVRVVLLGLVCALLLAVGVGWHATRDPRAEVVEESTGADAWKTIEYDGVRVDVPPAWRRSDMGDCEFAFEHWGPPGPPGCGRDGGVAFYRSATFDPARGPGVRRTGTGSGRGPAWAGYAYAGDLAVYAADDDRRVVQRVLDSAVGPGRR